MAKKNVIRPDASAVIVRILCWLAIIGGIGMIGYGVYTALEEQAAWMDAVSKPGIIGGIGMIAGACVVYMITNIACDLKTLRVNEYGIQGKTREFRNELLDRMHVAEQENMHLIRQQDEVIQLLKETAGKPEGKADRNPRRGVRVTETLQDEETDYELDLH